MDVNYSRWMSKDPDAEPDVVEDEPRRFSLPRPSRSAVASTALVSLVVLGGGAFVRSIATPEVSASQAQSVETPTAKQSSGPGAASVESASDDSTPVGSTLDSDVPDESASDDEFTSDNSASDDGMASDWPAPAGPPPGPRQMVRREVGPPDGVPPGRPMRERFERRRFP